MCCHALQSQLKKYILYQDHVYKTETVFDKQDLLIEMYGDRVNNPYRWSIATCNSYEVLLSLTLFYMILLYLSLLTSHEQHFFNGLAPKSA